MVIHSIADEVRQDCRRGTNPFGPSFFTEHLAVVAECAAMLGSRLGADPEILEPASYLHDLSAVRDPATLSYHAAASAELARRLLHGRGYSQTSIDAVAGAIASHSQPLAVGAASPEAVCLSNADAMSRMLRPAYWLYFAFHVRGLAFEEGRQWLLSLLDSHWRMLIEPARELVAKDYRISVEVLSRRGFRTDA